jgi:enoyl-CoA hydratase
MDDIIAENAHRTRSRVSCASRMPAKKSGQSTSLSRPDKSIGGPVDLQTLVFSHADGVATLTLNRPQRLNALNRMMLDEIQTVLDAVEKNDAIRVLVVTGAGTAFSSGFDLKEQMEARPQGTAAWQTILERDFDATVRFWNLRKPTIAAVHGHCLAGACELALCCDITICSEDAVFGEPELKFGAGIVTMILPWIVGPKQAKEIIFMGRDSIPADEALRLGLVNKVVPNGADLVTALAMARHIAAVDPQLMRQTKLAINRSCEIMGMRAALQASLDIDLQIESQGSPDKKQFMDIARKEGLRAAIAWRDARFPGRSQ